MNRRLQPPRHRAAGVLLALALGASPASAQAPATAAEEGDYSACAELAGRDPAAAAAQAAVWASAGGGTAARHCGAIALFGLGRYDEAAIEIEFLVEDMTDAPPTVQGELLAQASQAWLAAGHYERAEEDASRAHTLYPASVEILVDRAQARILLGRYWDAIDDLDRALEREPGHFDALVFRSSAYRLLEVPELAIADAERALEAAPGNVYALLERGAARAQAGDTAGARADWIEILRAAPESEAAESARQNLERLDIGNEP